MKPNPEGCESGSGSCGCGPSSLPRREFLARSGLGLAGLFAAGEAVAGPFEGEEFEALIPPNKKFQPEWIARLTARGAPEAYTGDDLRFIGMPVGGLCTGTLYLEGDGRLWLWNVFNKDVEGIDPKTASYAGRQLKARDGSAFVDPPRPMGPVDQGFVVRVRSAGVEKTVTLDRDGFRAVTFLGQYPIGTMTYRDPDVLVSARLEAYSPFIPLDADDSGLPAAVMSFTLTNGSRADVEVTLAGWLENAVGLDHRDLPGTRRNRISDDRGFTFLEGSAAKADNLPAAEGPFEGLSDVGTMGLALLGPPAEHRAAGAGTGPNGLGGPPGDTAEVPLDARLVGAIGRALTLGPGESAVVHFVVAWHFPNLTLAGRLKGRYYATRFPTAVAVARYVAENFDRLATVTKRWRDTWYDSTLPYWFLDRTFANTSVLATTTCYRLADGRFWAWEGVGCCPGTCTHVWHYAQAMGRLFPALERDLRERVDFGLALDPRTGVIRFRGEFGATFAVDGQCGTILRAYREHQMSADDGFLKRLWPGIRRASQCVIDRDADGSGVLQGPLHNTLDADWYGVVPWLVGLYHAALRAGEEMADEVGDAAFARTCRDRFEAGVRNLDRVAWRDEYGYYVHVGDPEHRGEVGSYDGCEIDQVFGQSWAWQVGLGRVMDEAHVTRSLRSLWRFSVTPDVGPYRRAHPAGRWYAMPGDGGLLMVTFPFGRPPRVSGRGAWSAMYFNECMTGFEWQVAAHMIWEGMVTEGLAVARLIHDRYHPRLRNPYNEVECSDHHARSMASYGAFLAARGFEYHGPKGHIGFAPRLGPDAFRAAFTAAEGWGTFAQRRGDGRLTAALRPVHGKVRIKTFALELPPGTKAGAVEVMANGENVAATFAQTGPRVVVTFGDEVRVGAGQAVELTVDHAG